MSLSFGAFIRRQRLEKGYTLRRFSEAMRLSMLFLSRMERDETAPSSEQIREIAALLALDPDALVALEADTPKKESRPLMVNVGCIGCSEATERMG